MARREPVNKGHTWLLKSNHNVLSKNLVVDKELLRLMYEDGLFRLISENEFDGLLYGSDGKELSQTERAEKFLVELQTRPDGGFEELCSALENSGLVDNVRLGAQLRKADLDGEPIAPRRKTSADPKRDKDCLAMHGHMQELESPGRETLLAKARDLLRSGNGVRNEIENRKGTIIHLPKPQSVSVNTSRRNIEEEQLAVLQEERARVQNVALVAEKGVPANTDGPINGRVTRPTGKRETLAHVVMEELRGQQQCFINLGSSAYKQGGEGFDEVTQYLRDIGYVDANSTVTEYTYHLPVRCLAIRGAKKLKSFGDRGSVLVKVLLEVDYRHATSCEWFVKGVMKSLGGMLKGGPLHGEAVHAEGDGTAVLVQMSGDSLKELYRMSEQHPGLLAGIGITEVSTVDGGVQLDVTPSFDDGGAGCSEEETQQKEALAASLRNLDAEKREEVRTQPSFEHAKLLASKYSFGSRTSSETVTDNVETICRQKSSSSAPETLATPSPHPVVPSGTTSTETLARNVPATYQQKSSSSAPETLATPSPHPVVPSGTTSTGTLARNVPGLLLPVSPVEAYTFNSHGLADDYFKLDKTNTKLTIRLLDGPPRGRDGPPRGRGWRLWVPMAGQLVPNQRLNLARKDDTQEECLVLLVFSCEDRNERMVFFDVKCNETLGVILEEEKLTGFRSGSGGQPHNIAGWRSRITTVLFNFSVVFSKTYEFELRQ